MIRILSDQIRTRLFMISHISCTVMLSFSFSNIFLYLKGMPCMNCSLIRLVLSSVRSMSCRVANGCWRGAADL